jgi:hypothetical protein
LTVLLASIRPSFKETRKSYHWMTHNPKVVGFNPTPATNQINQLQVEFE